MFKSHLLLSDSWPYDDALCFMENSFATVKNDASALLIGCGSHGERVITIGRNPDKQGQWYESALDQSVVFRQLDRGGGLTAHEPGQLVLYPIINLDHYGFSIPDFISLLEDTMIDFLAELGLNSSRSACGPGVFVGDHKIGFIGLRIKERITQHGLALNILNDANIFNAIDPCGIKCLRVTSAIHHTDLTEPMSYYQQRLAHHFLRLFFARTKIGTIFDVGVLLSNATDSRGTSTLASGK